MITYYFLSKYAQFIIFPIFPDHLLVDDHPPPHSSFQVKVTITRCPESPNVVEVSGRIDTDEAAEEAAEMDGGSRSGEESAEPSTPTLAKSPLQRVWPYLVRVFQAVLEDVERRRTLPFSVSAFVRNLRKFSNLNNSIPK